MTRTTHNTIADLRTQVAALHSELTRNNLVVWTAGNVSARVPGEDLLVIKPSGVSYDELSGLMVGQTLATRPEDQYRALLESTAYGTRMIVETFQEAGVPVTELVVAGGLLKNALLMQIYADVLDLPLSTIDSQQGPALGSAIHAAVAAGAYPDVATAARAMGRVNRGVHQPIEANVAAYSSSYAATLAAMGWCTPRSTRPIARAAPATSG